MDNNGQICVIKEQGDLGLFCDPLTDEEQKTVLENSKDEDEDK